MSRYSSRSSDLSRLVEPLVRPEVRVAMEQGVRGSRSGGEPRKDSSRPEGRASGCDTTPPLLVLIHDFTANHRQENTGLLYSFRWDFSEVPVDDGYIGQVAWGQLAPLLLGKDSVSISRRVRSQSFLDCDLLFRHPAPRILPIPRPPGDRGIDPLQRIERRHGPV